ncbi:hypothetical protein [Chitinophaga sancti]|uniref:Uncharacterized protein n=1 Tax=Chitinophaga sancti TaxID=1004 RepID=A0A1K1RX99_9BACT|nr:hypothetical protein [Chitinophaga sancti]WQD64044.1 hypothetical protein U0033_06520 [Chitinophaga sancti]WQG90332.1 hypothetical protein SR876_02400 [Chitinophaga sancti]SFW76697.1 hypothetical protein SAMN05661012_04398 [Chitinophaga sancti]
MPGLHNYTHGGDNDVALGAVCAAGDASGDDVSPCDADAAAKEDAVAKEDAAVSADDADAVALVAVHSIQRTLLI